MPKSDVLTYWYFQLPSLVLALFIYLLLGRLVLSPFLAADNLVMRALVAVTGPVVKAVGAITPRVVPSALVVAFAVLWLLGARILLHQAAMARRMFG
jgi:hypothetical protein